MNEGSPSRQLFVLADWNFHETEQYLLLFWPSRYDFLQAFLLKLISKPYRPSILPLFFFCKKGQKELKFQLAKVHSPHDISARIGTSCYSTHGKIYIFGGFYEGQKNYLEFQHDIVALDIQTFE